LGESSNPCTGKWSSSGESNGDKSPGISGEARGDEELGDKGERKDGEARGEKEWCGAGEEKDLEEDEVVEEEKERKGTEGSPGLSPLDMGLSSGEAEGENGERVWGDSIVFWELSDKDRWTPAPSCSNEETGTVVGETAPSKHDKMGVITSFSSSPSTDATEGEDCRGFEHTDRLGSSTADIERKYPLPPEKSSRAHETILGPAGFKPYCPWGCGCGMSKCDREFFCNIA
jgi:hypothetical protein